MTHGNYKATKAESPDVVGRPILFPYGLKIDGEKERLVHVDDAVRSNPRPTLFCPECRKLFEACSMERTTGTNYFRHKKNADVDLRCPGGNGETLLHMLGKQVFESTLVVITPAVIAAAYGQQENLSAASPRFISNVRIENRWNEFRPDVQATTDNGEEIAIEVAVHHKCTQKKIDSFFEKKLLSIEIDLSSWKGKPNLYLNPDGLSDFVYRDAPRRWIYNEDLSNGLARLKIAKEKQDEEDRSRALLEAEHLRKLREDQEREHELWRIQAIADQLRRIEEQEAEAKKLREEAERAEGQRIREAAEEQERAEIEAARLELEAKKAEEQRLKDELDAEAERTELAEHKALVDAEWARKQALKAGAIARDDAAAEARRIEIAARVASENADRTAKAAAKLEQEAVARAAAEAVRKVEEAAERERNAAARAEAEAARKAKEAAERIGLVRNKPGQPFEHYCMTCGEWGAFGYDVDLLKRQPGRWYCNNHKPS